MNLGELKLLVSTWANDSYKFECMTFMNPHSYRGYYNELAFELCDDPLTVADIKQFVHEAGTDTFLGWKGGEYTYDGGTPVHLSRQGDANDEEGHDFLGLVCTMDREYRSFNSEVCYNTSMDNTNTGTKMTTKLARKTAAQKRAEVEALRLEEQRLEDEKFVAEYQTRLLTLVHDYFSEMPQHLSTVCADEYKTFQFDASPRNYDVRLPLSVKRDTRTVAQLREDMEEAESFLERVREEQRKEREREQKKSAALSKLTKEERELLGL